MPHHERHRKTELALFLTSFAALLWALPYAFSRSSRDSIIGRDGYSCDVCGATSNLEACHKNHDKQHPDYDKPANGSMKCTYHHFLQHLESRGKAKRELGLSEWANEWAIREIFKRVPALNAVVLHELREKYGDWTTQE